MTSRVMRAGQVVQTGTPRQVWSAPRDEWVARFVGYRTVLSGPVAARLWATTDTARRGPAAVEALALRPAALVVDPFGPLTGTVRSVSPRPEGQALQVALGDPPDDAWAQGADEGARVAAAVAPADADVASGDTVRLTFRPEHAAVLPAAGRVVSSPDTAGSPADTVRSGTIDP